MGCSASTLDSEQSVTRCKDRKHFIKLAVRHRHAFAAAHAAYIQSLKNTGAAIRQFGDGESKDTQVTAEMPSNTPNLVHLPPPIPHFLASPTPGQTSPISRATSMPPLRNAATASPVKNPSPNSNPNHSFSHSRSPSPNPNFSPARNPSLSPARNPSLSPPGPVQEEEEEDDDAAVRKESYGVADAKPPPPPPSELPAPPPPPPPPKASPWEFLDVFPSTTESTDDVDTKAESQKLEEKQASLQDGAIIQKAELQELHEQFSIEEKGAPLLSPHIPAKAKMQGSGQDFSHILRELDDHFLAAYESGKEVARLLEARKMHYHSNFANANDSLDHSLRVLRVMSWGRNPQLPLTNGERIDFFHCGEKETHASTLDKLLAWEKKLHDEVKAGELIRIELERKSVQLKSQKKREENSVTLNKTKAVVKSLQTRYLVEIQAVDAATLEVDKLRDECLHKQLVDLVKELMSMWNCMLECHRQQYKLIKNVESLDSSYSPLTTNDFHLKNTSQLETEVNLWHQNFDKLITTQKEYINAVYQWLRLHIIQIESDGKETPGSPQKMSTPPVYHLCREWLSKLNQIPGNVTLHALKAFSNIIHELSLQQADEFKQKRKLDGLRKELERKEQIFKAQEMKYNERRSVQQSIDEKEEMGQEGGNPLKEKERMVKLLREAVEAENERYEQMCSNKGMPRVSLSLEKLAGSSAEDAMGLITVTLLKAFKHQSDALETEQRAISQLKESLAAAKEETRMLQQQVDATAYRGKKKGRVGASQFSADATDASFSQFDAKNGAAQATSGPTTEDSKSKTTGRVALLRNKVHLAHAKRAKQRGSRLADADDT